MTLVKNVFNIFLLVLSIQKSICNLENSVCSNYGTNCQELSGFTPNLNDYSIEKEKFFQPPIDDLHMMIKKSFEEASNYYNNSIFNDLTHSSDIFSKNQDENLLIHEKIFPSIVSLLTTEKLIKKFGSYKFSTKGTSIEKHCKIQENFCGNENYRSADGKCNNVYHPTWGTTNSRFQRLIPGKYYDGIQIPRKSINNINELPNPYLIGNLLFTQEYKKQQKLTNLLTHWANFIYHDLSKIKSSKFYVTTNDFNENICCSNQFSHPECLPIFTYNSNSNGFDLEDQKCIPYIRTILAPRDDICSFGPREQGNQATAFLDASTIYGNTKEEQLSIRLKSGGKINDNSFKLTKILSLNEEEDSLNQISSVMVNLWQKQHNKIAENLSQLNSHWDDNIIFEEARRIVIAQIQFITLNEYLPILIGHETVNYYKLKTTKYDDMEVSTEEFYDLNIEPNTFNSFATAVGNFYLTIISNNDKNLLFNAQSHTLLSKNAESLIIDLLESTISRPGLHIDPSYSRNNIFDNVLFKKTLDYPTFLIQLSRDNGLGSYTEYREKCGGSIITSFDDLWNDIINPEKVIPILKKYYVDVRDVELPILGLAEKPVRGALVGPTFGCILGLQFRTTKNSDRFWFDNIKNPKSFTFDQLSQIRKTTLANVLCNALSVSCNTTIEQGINLRLWKDNSPANYKKESESLSDIIESFNGLPSISKNKMNLALKKGYENLKLKENFDTRNFNKQFDDTYDASTPLNSYAALMKAKPKALDLHRLAKLKWETMNVIMNGDVDILSNQAKLTGATLFTNPISSNQISGIIPFVDVSSILNISQPTIKEDCHPQNLPCDHTSPYRTSHGWCNNLKNPSFGMSFGPMKHLLPVAYEDGFSVPRSFGVSGKPLPLPRRITNIMNDDVPIFQKTYSHMVMQFGQFLDHEITHVPTETGPNGTNVDCSSCNSQETVNINYGSTIYGSTPCETKELRLFQGGLLKFSDLNPINHEGLPTRNDNESCRSRPQFDCFKAGDSRNTHQPSLTVIHNIMLREHNRIARNLETRKIIGGIFQHIVYSEYLPILIGKSNIEKFNLFPQNKGYFKGYDDTCDASISHPFSTAAFRFGHTLARSNFKRLDAYYREFSDDLLLKDNFDNAEPIYNVTSGGFDTILVGLLGTPSMEFDRFITSHLRNFLFAKRGQKFSGFDLIAINIQRARDHGVQPYNQLREYCGFGRAKTFHDLSDFIDEDAIERLSSLYESVDDIDLFTGLISERSLKGALLSPTASCIIGEQFERLKKCDRFYYENNLPHTKFSEDQLQEIRKVSLAKIFCDNSDILTKIQPNIFELPDDLVNAQIPCNAFSQIDLTKWSQHPSCTLNDKVLAIGQFEKKSPCMGCICTTDGLRCQSTIVKNCQNLLEEHNFIDIAKDSACVIQCPQLKTKIEF
ncbi:Peroxidasin-like protein [Strongyloides ratti]|uniref:peroxidase n=1 Tax=Strongyloides ratti TaxID=34506 RepID=A0A090LLX6_STRRB|nr:Peroxidasin-like protein [Strongyloides ratti]CEF70696.1 Peroxidasin-like protein [Strongyloides ratti]